MSKYRFKGDTMDVSSSTSSNSTQSSTQIEVMKKARDIQEQSMTKMLESATEQSKQVTAQKTGVGSGIDITA